MCPHFWGRSNISLSWSIGGNLTGSAGMFVSMFEGDEHCRFNYTITNRFTDTKQSWITK